MSVSGCVSVAQPEELAVAYASTTRNGEPRDKGFAPRFASIIFMDWDRLRPRITRALAQHLGRVKTNEGT
jgi:hypothetical protein